jgi:hypothetical protein
MKLSKERIEEIQLAITLVVSRKVCLNAPKKVSNNLTKTSFLYPNIKL